MIYLHFELSDFGSLSAKMREVGAGFSKVIYVSTSMFVKAAPTKFVVFYRFVKLLKLNATALGKIKCGFSSPVIKLARLNRE